MLGAIENVIMESTPGSRLAPAARQPKRGSGESSNQGLTRALLLGGPDGHISSRILQTMVSGMSLVLGPQKQTAPAGSYHTPFSYLILDLGS